MTTTNKAIKLISLTLLIIMLFQPIAFAVENGLVLDSHKYYELGKTESKKSLYGIDTFIGGIIIGIPSSLVVGLLAIGSEGFGFALAIPAWYIGHKRVKNLAIKVPDRYRSSYTPEEFKYFEKGYKESIIRKRTNGYNLGMLVGSLPFLFLAVHYLYGIDY